MNFLAYSLFMCSLFPRLFLHLLGSKAHIFTTRLLYNLLLSLLIYVLWETGKVFHLLDEISHAFILY